MFKNLVSGMWCQNQYNYAGHVWGKCEQVVFVDQSERTVDLCVSDDKVLPIDERPQNDHKPLKSERLDAWSKTA